jgi:hypothetical protein
MNHALTIDKSQLPADIAPASSQLTPMQMAYQLITNGADLGSVKEMLAMSRELAAEQARQAFDAAMSAAKSEITPVIKNATGHNSKKYADFAAIAKAVDPIISRHGLSYRFRTKQDERIHVTCILAHEGGHSEETTLAGPPDATGSKNAIQAIGSTLTYLQRYTLTHALGLAASDDDDAKTAEDHPISGAAEAAINSVRECKSLPAMTAWKEKNDPMVQKLDRNDQAAFRRAWSDHAATLRAGAAQ